jgi:hypothetical protein
LENYYDANNSLVAGKKSWLIIDIFGFVGIVNVLHYYWISPIFWKVIK